MKNLTFTLAVVSFSVSAANLNLTVVDNEGKPVADAIVLMQAEDRTNAPSSKPSTAAMQQKDKQFQPHVLPVAVGTRVEFPNADSVKHHVYSFSDAKTFELELYDDFAGTPIVFDKPGIVELGCNIHDWMLAYIYVTDADYFFTTSDAGKITAQVPDGDYTLQLWHPLAQTQDLNKDSNASIQGDFTLTLSFAAPFEEALDYSSGFDDY